MCKTSDNERKKDWWLRHFKTAGIDLVNIVKKTLEGDKESELMLRAWLPAFEQTFTVSLGEEKDVGKGRSN